MTHWSDKLVKLGACIGAVEWAKTQPSARVAWAKCDRADWMLWYAARCKHDQKKLVLAACACARLSLRYIAKGENRPRVAIETAERWVKGKATISEVKSAAYAAYAASAAAYAAASAADAADAAAYAANASGAKLKTLKRCAVIVRRMLQQPTEARP